MNTDTDLVGITVTNGVNERGEPFVTIAATGRGGTILIGQASPDELREHALSYLGAAEAAEQDAATLRTIRKLELPDELAGRIIAELRDSR